MGFRQNPFCWMILAVSASWVGGGFSQAQDLRISVRSERSDPAKGCRGDRAARDSVSP